MGLLGGGTPVPTGGVQNMDPRQPLEFLRRPESRQGELSFTCICGFDTSALTVKISHEYGTTGDPDLSNQTYWNTVWWLNMIKPWYDTVPSGNWYKIAGRPVIFIWSVNYFSNRIGNEVPLLNYLEAQFKGDLRGWTRFSFWTRAGLEIPRVASDPAVVASITPGFPPPTALP